MIFISIKKLPNSSVNKFFFVNTKDNKVYFAKIVDIFQILFYFKIQLQVIPNLSRYASGTHTKKSSPLSAHSWTIPMTNYDLPIQTRSASHSSHRSMTSQY